MRTSQLRIELYAPDETRPAGNHSRTLSAELAQIYDEHFDFVWRNARRLGVSEANAEDVVQDVFIVVHRRLADFRGGPIRPWIFGILTRVVHDHQRSHRRKTSRWVPLAHDTARDPEQRDQSPAERAEFAERVRLLDALLGQLSDEHRTLIVLAELEEWTLREIAEYFGSNVNTVFSRLRAAKQRFEQAYARALAKAGEKP